MYIYTYIHIKISSSNMTVIPACDNGFHLDTCIERPFDALYFVVVNSTQISINRSVAVKERTLR